MEAKRLNSECIPCLLKKYLPMHPEDATEEKKAQYMKRILHIVADAPDTASAPEIVDEICKVQKEIFDFAEDYSETKRYFNNFMLELVPKLEKKIAGSEDGLKTAVCLSMTGNYIDFGAMNKVDEKKLCELLDNAEKLSPDENEFQNFRRELQKAKKLVFLTDNCGEIVLDKLLVSEIKKQSPDLDIAVIVRGAPVLNDATMTDALQVGFEKEVRVLDNGSTVAGTCIERISDTARNEIKTADLIVAKGQGNFETLRFCGENVYYLFMCKCMMFAKRFGVPQYSPMLLNDLRMDKGVGGI